jgi:hypothetical protein
MAKISSNDSPKASKNAETGSLTLAAVEVRNRVTTLQDGLVTSYASITKSALVIQPSN